MLYEKFDLRREDYGIDFFTSRIGNEVIQNLNPKFALREYQKEALGRFDFYFSEYVQKQNPLHLMFNMATGSGKTLIMAAQILYLYKKGYRNFIFFTRLGNIIEKSKENFLNPLAKKYLFAEKIVVDGKEIKVKEVKNFETKNEEDVNIIFSTTALLHNRFNYARENVLTYEDFVDKKIVLMADEAHNLSAETTRKKLTKTEQEDLRCWENTVLKLRDSNLLKENILLEFTATARLEDQYPEILEKYKNKAIFRYDFKNYRQDGFSKDVKTIQANATFKERVLAAVVISQYRLKIAEKYKIFLKPIILFKSNRVSQIKEKLDIDSITPQIVVSKEVKSTFHKIIANLDKKTLDRLKNIDNETLGKAFNFFEKQGVGLENLAIEIKNDFALEKCLSVDEGKELEQKQILLNSLENPENKIRAIFATEKLNEGWDVLNLFDIVRLYNSRDAKSNKPGKTTVAEAQLIGRGARYYPFTTEKFSNPYVRKFDNDEEDELRILEVLYYHSTTNPRYIQELESVLKKEGIISSRLERKEIKVKKKFKDSYFWKKGIILLNEKKERLGKGISSLRDARVDFDYTKDENIFSLPTKMTIERYVYKKNKEVEEKKEQKDIKVKDFYLSSFEIPLLSNC